MRVLIVTAIILIYTLVLLFGMRHFQKELEIINNSHIQQYEILLHEGGME